jgi:hypothetical protein
MFSTTSGFGSGGPASRCGIALHDAVSSLLLRWGETSPEEEVAKVASRRRPKAEERAYVMELMEEFDLLFAPRIIEVVVVEEPIAVRVGYIRVVGRVDAVVETEEGLELWEFKAGRANGYLDSFPLGVYALGIEELIGRVLGRWAYVKLRQAEARLYMGGEETAEAVKQEVEKVVGQLREYEGAATPSRALVPRMPVYETAPGEEGKSLDFASSPGMALANMKGKPG